jgi:gluconolactonase
VDDKGNVWATGPGGVHVFTAGGEHLGTIATTVKTGNLALGDNGDVFITADSMLLHLERHV